MFGGRGQTKACNFVHNDEIWKDHVKMEILAQRKWPDKWGFIAQDYNNLQQDLMEIGDEFTDKSKDVTASTDQIKPDILQVDGQTTAKRFPRTDSELIGWRLHHWPPTLNNLLAHSGKKDITKQLGWPREGF